MLPLTNDSSHLSQKLLFRWNEWTDVILNVNDLHSPKLDWLELKNSSSSFSSSSSSSLYLPPSALRRKESGTRMTLRPSQQFFSLKKMQFVAGELTFLLN